MAAVYIEIKPRKRLKQSAYYKKGRPGENHVKKFKIHKIPVKCKCFICGEIWHYARNYTQNIVKKEIEHASTIRITKRSTYN